MACWRNILDIDCGGDGLSDLVRLLAGVVLNGNWHGGKARIWNSGAGLRRFNLRQRENPKGRVLERSGQSRQHIIWQARTRTERALQLTGPFLLVLRAFS
jgi:hypothetical protein